MNNDYVIDKTEKMQLVFKNGEGIYTSLPTMELSNTERTLRGHRASLPLVEDEFFNTTVPPFALDATTSAGSTANSSGFSIEEMIESLKSYSLTAPRGQCKTWEPLAAMLRSYIAMSITKENEDGEDKCTFSRSESLDDFLKEFERRKPDGT